MRRLARRAALAGALLSALALPACIGKLPPRQLFRLAPGDSLPADSGGMRSVAPGSTALDGTLAIVPYETPGLYGERGIVFRVGEAEYGVYPSREWALPLGDMLGALTARIARNGALTRDRPLFDPPSQRSQTFLWRARVREFEEVNRGSALLVAVRIEATIVRTADDSVVWSGDAGREAPVTGGADMQAIVRTLSTTASGVIAELLQRAERDLGRGGRPAVVRPATAAEPARREP